jgi:hypothetical protein
MEGGTPHEAAADSGLLELAQTLRRLNDTAWLRYFKAAQYNVYSYLLGKLWNGQGFRDQPWNETLVPNKNATTIEALILYETVSGEDMSAYIPPAIEVILSAQEKDGPRAGGTVHLGSGHHRLAIGIYTARSIGGLLRAYERQPKDQWLEAVSQAIRFIRGLFSSDGPAFGRYPNGELISGPLLIAGAGDLLRAFASCQQYGLAAETDVRWLMNWLIQSQSPSGGVPTGAGFARRGDSRPYTGLPEFRDLLPVVGWNDKTFRALALIVPGLESNISNTTIREVQRECTWKGHPCIFHENADSIVLYDARRKSSIYHWDKGTCYPSTYCL